MTPCRKWAITGGARCRLHGVLSTGPRTPEGVKRIQLAKTVHGWYSKASIAVRRELQIFTKEARSLLRSFERE
ncbi:MAG: HGGxSTG domain-containing protein [Bryobacteraceae bacterium]